MANPGQHWWLSAGITEDRLAKIVRRSFPLSTRQKLARGPMLPGETGDVPDEEFDCRVCEALVPLESQRGHQMASYLLDWHFVDEGRGEEAYRRCVAIYRAAGWTGEYDARALHGFEGDDG